MLRIKTQYQANQSKALTTHLLCSIGPVLQLDALRLLDADFETSSGINTGAAQALRHAPTTRNPT